jgi:hypothetical protein
MIPQFVPTAFMPQPAAGGAYSGPGDVVSGATAWWGLRGYNAAVSNGSTKSVNVRRSSDNTTQDFVILSNGNLDVASISSFIGGGNGFVTTLYDQSGTNNLTQGNAANQPQLILSGLGSLPIMQSTGSQFMFVTTSTVDTQPFTASAVAIRTGSFTSSGMCLTSQSPFVQLGFQSVANTLHFFAGTDINVSANDNVWRSLNAVYNGASSVLYVDGTANSGNAGTNNWGSAGTTWGFMGFVGGSYILNGDQTEGGLWPIGFSATQAANMSTNQHSYWGF